MTEQKKFPYDKGAKYHGYSKEDIKNKKDKVIGSDFPDESHVRLQFEQRYGMQPDIIAIVTSNLMLVGPVPVVPIEEQFDFDDYDD